MAKKNRKKGRFSAEVGADVKRQKMRGSAYGYLNLPKGVNMFKEPLEGDIRLDFLPYEVTNPNHADQKAPGKLWYKAPFRIHRGVGPAEDSVVCPVSFGKRCPICEMRTKRLKEGADKEELRPMNSSPRNLYCVVPLGEKEYEEKPYLWDISAFCFQDELTDELDQDEANWNFPDLEDGLTVAIRLVKKSFDTTKFGFTKRVSFEERDEAYDEAILDEVPKLDDLLTVLSYEELERKWMGVDEVEAPQEEEEEEEVEQVPEPTTRRRKKTVVPEPEEEARPVEDDDVPFDEDEEEPEPEPKPTRRKRTAPAKEEGENLCPYGHKYGVDTDEPVAALDCSTCDAWDKCIDIKNPI